MGRRPRTKPREVDAHDKADDEVAFRAGRAAYRADIPWSANPYTGSSASHRHMRVAWRRGWDFERSRDKTRED